jgi:2,4-dienoyl-CoA reductase-like NADH-dependent reductase (Old Yellow Enzyme family)/thioredoxin reductase
MNSKPLLEKLFEPSQIGQMTLRNRIVMPPMGTNLGSAEGYVTDQLKDYYEERAKGGAGLIIVEATCVEFPRGRGFIREMSIDDDKFLPGLRELVQVIHRHDVKVALQLHHAGNGTKASITGLQPVAPSPITRPHYDPPRELTPEEIADLVFRFATAAERARKAGFDGVEIHAAHHYLIAQFLSSAWNKREDAYGGELKNKARFLLEVVRAIRELVGQDYPVWCRVNGREYGIKEGITLEETQQLAQMLQDAGIDALHISAYAYANPRSVPPMSVRLGTMLPLAEAIKKVVSIPVIAVGRISPEVGAQALEEGRADFVAIGRGLIADPELPRKAASGRLEEITPCIACNTCMDCVVDWNESLRCTTNPAAGKEREYRLAPAPQPKKVFIVGGGPAGMAAARVAKLRGHEVELWERENKLGGQLLTAALPPHKSGIPVLTSYLASQMDRLDIKVELGKAATPAIVEQKNPDVVILATGSIPLVPDIPGIDRGNVVTAQQVLTGEAKVGEKVVVIGGELVGCETAEFLADQGKQVTVVRRGAAMAEKLSPSARELLLLRLEAKGVTLLTGVKYEEISEKGLTIITREGERKTLEADTIVLAAGARSDIELFQALQGKVKEVYLAGDCVQPRRIVDAISEGSQIALKI